MAALAVVMIIVQSCDADVGVTVHYRMKTPVPAGTAVANLADMTSVWPLGAAGYEASSQGVPSA